MGAADMPATSVVEIPVGAEVVSRGTGSFDFADRSDAGQIAIVQDDAFLDDSIFGAC